MSWDKIENHLFEKYCVEGEDKELCKLIEAHDKEIRDKAISSFAENLKKKYGCLGWIDEITFEEVDEIAEQTKEEINATNFTR